MIPRKMERMFRDFETYLHSQKDHSPHTIKAYLSDLRQLARWFEETNGEKLTPVALTRTDLRQYRHYMLNVKGLSANTINRRLASISAYLNWAREKGIVEINPAEKVNGIKEQSVAPKWLSKKEESALVSQAEKELQLASLGSDTAKLRGVRNWALVVFLLHTGLRASEVCSLRLEDLAINTRSGSVQVVGKGAKQRTVPLNKEAREAINQWLDARPDCDHDTVFVGQRLTPLSTSALRRVISELSYQAKLEDVSPHTLRHTFGKRLVDSGVSLEKVAALMGHANLNTTKIYTTPSQRDLEKAVKVLEY
jgi:integrase/recombinase XerC